MSPVQERAFLATPAIGASGKVIASPFQFYVTGEDHLRLAIWSSVATTVSVHGRWLTPSQDIQVFRHLFTTGASRARETHIIPLASGFLLNCAVAIAAGTVKAGQTFVQLRLVRGRDSAITELGTVLQGYIGTAGWLAFPGSPIQGCLEGPGFLTTAASGDPAAGSQISSVCPAHTRWRVLAWNNTLATSAVAGTRNVGLTCITDTGPTLFRAFSSFAHTAGLTITYVFAPGLELNNVSGSGMTSQLPNPTYLSPFWEIRTFVNGFDVGDNWGPSRVMVEEWIDIDETETFPL